MTRCYLFASLTSLEGLETLDLLARRYSTSPAASLGIDDPLIAYCVNEAAAFAGIAAEQRLLARATAPAHRTPAHAAPAATAPKPLTIEGGRISGIARIDESAAPPWIDDLFPSVSLEELAKTI